MYWLITAYDVLDHIHLAVRCVDDTEEGPLQITWRTSSTWTHKPRVEHDERDVLAEIAEELLNHAYEPSESRTTA